MDILKKIEDSIPTPPNKLIGYISLILNIIFPGLGTIIAAIISKSNSYSIQIIVGILQFPFISAFFGYVWAIYWGYRILKNSRTIIGPDIGVENNIDKTRIEINKVA